MAAAIGAGALIPVSAQAAHPVVKLKVTGSAKLLTYAPQNGFATLKSSAAALPDQQRWEQIDGPGPTVFYRNVANQQCLRANPVNSVFVRTVACDFSDGAASRQQQWILSGTGQLANRDRLISGASADSLSVDFANINRTVNMAPFTFGANQKWTALAG